MKKIVIVLSMLVAVVSCKKTDEIVTPQNPLANKIKTIEYEHTIDSFQYNGNQQLAIMSSKEKATGFITRSNFTYKGNLIEKVSVGGATFSYSYPSAANNVIDLALFVSTNPNIRYNITKANGKINEVVQANINGSVILPTDKIVFVYDNKGNISKQQIFQKTLTSWELVEEGFFTYDDKPNTTSRFEFFAAVLNEDLMTNNPIKIDWKAPNGAIIKTTTYNYTYNSKGLKTKAIVTNRETGLADVVETIVYTHY
jgi:hypothetical protein